MDDNFDFVIGQKAMYELREEDLILELLTFQFLMRSIPLKAMQRSYNQIQENLRLYGLQMLAVPPDFKGGTGVVKIEK